MKRALLYSPHFSRKLKKWVKAHPESTDSIAETLEKLAADATQPSLRTHKLRGPLAGSWACSAGHDVRLVFDYVDRDGSEAILLNSIGTHDEVY